MKTNLRLIAPTVPDLREAEHYYQPLFGMKLFDREADMEDWPWYTLPLEKGWDDADNAGIDLGMLALRKGEIILALFPGKNPTGQVQIIGLALPQEQIIENKKELPPEIELLLDDPEGVTFRDRCGIVWQLVPPGTEFLMWGDSENRWINL